MGGVDIYIYIHTVYINTKIHIISKNQMYGISALKQLSATFPPLASIPSM